MLSHRKEKPYKAYVKKLKNGFGIKTINRITGVENILLITSDTSSEDGNNKKIKLWDSICTFKWKLISFTYLFPGSTCPTALTPVSIPISGKPSFVNSNIFRTLEPYLRRLQPNISSFHIIEEDNSETPCSNPNRQKASIILVANTELAREKGVHFSIPGELMNTFFVESVNDGCKIQFTANPIVEPLKIITKDYILNISINYEIVANPSLKLTNLETIEQSNGNSGFLGKIPAKQTVCCTKLDLENKQVQTYISTSDQYSQTSLGMFLMDCAMQTEFSSCQSFNTSNNASSQRNCITFGKSWLNLRENNGQSVDKLFENQSLQTESQSSLKPSYHYFEGDVNFPINDNGNNDPQLALASTQSASLIGSQGCKKNQVLKIFEKRIINTEQNSTDSQDETDKLEDTFMSENNLVTSTSFMNTSSSIEKPIYSATTSEVEKNNTSTNISIEEIKNRLNTTKSSLQELYSFVELFEKKSSEGSLGNRMCNSEVSSSYIREILTENTTKLLKTSFEKGEYLDSRSCFQIMDTFKGSPIKESQSGGFLETLEYDESEKRIKKNSDLSGQSFVEINSESQKEEVNVVFSSCRLCEKCGCFYKVEVEQEHHECIHSNDINQNQLRNELQPYSTNCQDIVTKRVDIHNSKKSLPNPGGNSLSKQTLIKLLKTHSNITTKTSKFNGLKISDRCLKVGLNTQNKNQQIQNLDTKQSKIKRGDFFWPKSAKCGDIGQKTFWEEQKHDKKTCHQNQNFYQNQNAFQNSLIVNNELKRNSFPFMNNFSKEKMCHVHALPNYKDNKSTTTRLTRSTEYIPNKFSHCGFRYNVTSKLNKYSKESLIFKTFENVMSKIRFQNKIKSMQQNVQEKESFKGNNSTIEVRSNTFREHKYLESNVNKLLDINQESSGLFNEKNTKLFKHLSDGKFKSNINEPSSNINLNHSGMDLPQNLKSFQKLRNRPQDDSFLKSTCGTNSAPNIIESTKFEQSSFDQGKRVLTISGELKETLKEDDLESQNLSSEENSELCIQDLSFTIIKEQNQESKEITELSLRHAPKTNLMESFEISKESINKKEKVGSSKSENDLLLLTGEVEEESSDNLCKSSSKTTSLTSSEENHSIKIMSVNRKKRNSITKKKKKICTIM